MSDDVDIGLDFSTSPPLLVPISDRAKTLLNLPDGANCALIRCPAEQVLAAFPKDFVIYTLTSFTPTLIAPMNIQRLH